MIALAARTAAARMATLAGPFIALALGTALLSAVALNIAAVVGIMTTTSQPRWFARPAAVVAGISTVRVTSSSGGDQETESVRTDIARAVPAGLAARLSALGAPVVVDYAGYGRAAGVPGSTVHPWAAASLHPYRWIAGGPPRAVRSGQAPQLVLTAPTPHRPGERITVATASGPRAFVVSGVIRTGAQAALYAAGPVAAQLAGNRIAAVALLPATGRSGQPPQRGRPAQSGHPGLQALAARARAVSRGSPVQVLTGASRSAAEPDPDADLSTVAIAVLGTAAGLAVFMAIFVVAGTFGQSVTARRRELGLLRAVGATPRQLRRLVLGEALLVATLATLPGGLLGAVTAATLSHWLARAGLAPAGLSARFASWPIAAAAGACVLVGLLGALGPARRAGRVRPAEALREAAADRRVMLLSRWLAGLGALIGVPLVLAAFAGLHSMTGAALILPAVMLMICCLVMLAPLTVAPLAWLLAPLTGGRGAAGLLARRNAVGAARRTSAAIAPVLLTVGFAGALLAGNDTLYGAQQQSAASRVVAPVTVTPAAGADGLADSTLAAIRSAPGVTASVPVAGTTVYVRSGGDPDDWAGQYVGPGFGGAVRLPILAGRIADLTGTGTVAVPAGTWRLGQIAQIWLADSTPVRLRVVAVYASQLDLEQTVLLPWALLARHTSAPLASAAYLRLRPGAALTGLRAAAAAGGGRVVATRHYLATGKSQNERFNEAALLAVLGLALLYSCVAIGNTAAMGVASRGREFGALRLAGSTRGQVLAMVGWETWLATAIGIVLAGGAAAVTLAGVRIGLAGVAPASGLVIPWCQAGLIALAALVIAELASLAPAAWILRRRPADLASGF
jgi:putative ABC transport system permease protein